MPYSKLPPAVPPRGSHRDWRAKLQLPHRLELSVHGLVERRTAAYGFAVWDVGENRLVMAHGGVAAEGAEASPEIAELAGLTEGLGWLIRQQLYRRRTIATVSSPSIHAYLAGNRPVPDQTLRSLVLQTRAALNRFPQLELRLTPPRPDGPAALRARQAYVEAEEAQRNARIPEVLLELHPAGPGRFRVGDRYTVDLSAGTCSCPDFGRVHSDRYPIRCKHLLAAAVAAEQAGATQHTDTE